MSQLNGDAIEKIQELTLAAVHTQELKTTLCPTVMLPSGYGIESLERFNLHRFRFRGALETTSIADFVRYSVGYAVTDTPARCFIDAESMSARAVFNIGSLDEPGHADNVASIRLKKTAPFRALLTINGERLSQKQIAEASLMRAIASRLDVTFVALTEALDQNKALKAELEPLRGGH